MKNNRRNFFVICLTIFCSVFTYGQIGEVKGKPKEPILTPLTETEKKVDLIGVVANQPDFTAVQNYFSAREISGFSASSKIARKGGKYRNDTGFVAIISEPGKSDLRLNSNKTYETSIGVRKPYISATSPLNPTDLLGFKDISFTALGTIEVDGNKLLKIQAKSAEFEQEVFLYADLNRKNLITIIQILGPKRSSIQRLLEVSFTVPNELFDISDYKELPKFKWNKVKTAKVFFKGNPVDEALVFRSGDYFFIHIAEFEHFFVDLKSKVADTVVFQGLLVASDGNYVWRTKEEEAVSIGELDNYVKPGCDSCVKLQLESNNINIPNPENKSKILVKVTW